MRPEDQFHVGIVVDDLDATLARLSDLFGYEWCDEMAAPTPVSFPTGDAVVEFRFRYSRNAPRLEIIQSIPGTLWTPVDGSGIHHLGYWSDDVARDSAALDDRGVPREAAGTRPDGAVSWAYHRAASGPRIELVATELRPFLEQYFTTGKVPGT
jgi:catechol 2,3-dioxygenase-like lactoylglutathione lyase family enzyme